MGRKLVAWTLCAIVASMMVNPLVVAGDETLIGWWKLSDGTGNVAKDSSDYGNDGTIVNAAGGLGTNGSVWYNDPERGVVASFNGTDSTGACVKTNVTVPAMTLQNDFTWVFWAKQHADQATNNDVILGNRYGGSSTPQFIKFTPTRFECYNNDSSYINGINYTSIPTDVWIHHAVVKDGASLTYYRDGEVVLTNTMTLTIDPNPFYMGADGYSGVQEAWEGYLSDVRLYERSLTQTEVKRVMAGKGPDAQKADEPSPEDEATDVLRDVQLSWTAGDGAQTHNVYFGTSKEAVEAATTGSDLLVSEGQTETMFDVGQLEFGVTYYWRVDEVGTTVTAGDVWSFTVELYSYAITAANITATASSASSANSTAVKTIDGSGLTNDQHSIADTDMWLSSNGDAEPWLQYEFDQVYRMDKMLVWNSNLPIESIVGAGARAVTILTSLDGENWTTLGDFEFAQASGTTTYTANTTIDFAGAAAKYVKLAIASNWSTIGYKQYSVSEVRFFEIPTYPTDPTPRNGATGQEPAVTLSWKSGREAVSHQVYLGTDANDMTLLDTVAEGTCDVDLSLGQTYYWKVVEVNDAMTPSTWESPVWSFSTDDSLLIDGFESYTDEEGSAIFQIWIDGYGVSENGSLVGYDVPPYAEQTVFFAGAQSMPLRYNNISATYSEAVLSFEDTQDWTAYGVQTLSLYFLGDSTNTGTGQLYVKINGTKVLYDGAATDLLIGVWQPWTIDLASTGVNLKKVTSLTIGVSGSGATGTLLIDEIRLYPAASATITPADPGTTGLVAYYPFDGDATDAAGNHDGTASGSPGYATGKVGKALNMPSDAQYVTVAYAADLAMNTFTVAAWVNVADLDALRAILGTRFTSDYTFDLKVASTRIHGDIGNGSAWLNTSLDISTAQGGIIGIGEWHHVAYVIDNATQKCYMYLDGALGATASFSGTPLLMKSDQVLRIGNCSGTEYMHGQIDEVRLYNRALSSAEVAGLVGRTGTIYVAP